MKLYGAAYSRAGRCIWMLEEIGQPYELDPVDPRSGRTRSPEMLKLNPNGHVPVLEDDGYVIWESLAINQYLAEKTGTLWPAGAQAHGQVAQWSLWAMTEVEPHLVTMLMHMMFLPEAQRSPAAIDEAKAALRKPMQVLNDHLAARAYL
ncbi:glutathione S-transferase family protein, partial [Immundisolibacter sp.]|uniref:glutathione S-transferase family protein n=1 Tax=Immundisolibacter sp. TaxID=1934948 RepID=UPI00260480CA